MKRSLGLCIAAVTALALAAPASALKIIDPTPTGSFSDGENAGYVEIAADDGSGALLRVCNESSNTPAGDELTGYLWVNPSGEDTPATYGNEIIGAGDEDGEDGGPPLDGDADTSDDCPPADGP